MLSFSITFTCLQTFLLFLAVRGGNDFEQYAPFTLPEVQYPELLAMDPISSNLLVEQLTSLGAVQITNIPKFDVARKEALEATADCLRREASSKKWVMSDGSIRYSTAAETINGVRGSMTNQCGDSASRLRSIIDSVVRQVFLTLDERMRIERSFRGGSDELLMKPSYSTFSELSAKGNHLEHLHAYFPASDVSENPATMDFHTDAGLMIAMTTGHFAQGQPSSRSGLYLSRPVAYGKEEKVKAVMSDDSLILLMGEGSKNWLKQVFDKPFRPVPHALVVDIPTGSENSRTWFGKMFLPPSDAVLPKEMISYKQFHQYEADFQSNRHYLPLACGGSDPSYQIILQNQPCDASGGEPGVYCWTQCQSVADLPCGQNAQCVDTNTGEIIEDGEHVHCTEGGVHCELQCVPANNATTTSDDYCYGDGTTMSMSGFFSLVSDEKGTTPCVNFLFEDWTLDNPTKFAFACLGVICLGMFTQYLIVLRGTVKTLSNIYHRRLARTSLFCLQIVLSYFLMLIAMSYSAELFSMVCIGLTFGYGLFHSSDSKDSTEISADACCPEGGGYDRLSDENGEAILMK